jgi:3-hydroxymyristoyl/3-hydroxydecanoyl-(acyl carrier protein) dehydratase
MMEIVKELLQNEVNKPLMLSHADNVKFLQLITPGVAPTIKITWKENETGYAVNAVFKTDAAFHFKLTGNYIIADSISAM